ncbi:MAG: hypothetical protein SNH73_03465 [Rikenellaceae bacterium]
MRVKNLYVGKWEFIKAERHNGSQWEATDLAQGMIWEFNPIFFSEHKTIGNIAEFTPERDNPISLNYTFSDIDNSLRVEVYKDPLTRIKDEIDIYDLTTVTQTLSQTTIVITLINQIGCWAPYLRYTLRQLNYI